MHDPPADVTAGPQAETKPKTDTAAPRGARLHELDGLRGWAALGVVLFHVFWECFGVVAPEFRNPVTGFFFDGDLAVAVFFVLSGEALSTAHFSGKDRSSTVRLAIKRYPRLVVPVLASCLIVYLLCRCDLVFNIRAGEIVGRAAWLGAWLHFPVSLGYTLIYAASFVLFDADMGRNLNPFLWTIQMELLGSLIVFILIRLMDRSRNPRRWLAVIFFVLACAPAPTTRLLGCFVAGMLFAEFRARGGFARMQTARAAPVALMVVVAAAVGDGLLHWHGYRGLRPLLAVPLLGGVFASAALTRFFASPVSRVLGRISFPLYLMQYPVLISFTSWAIVGLSDPAGLDRASVWLISLASVAVCIVVSVLFVPVETFTAAVGARLVAALALVPRFRPAIVGPVAAGPLPP